MLNCLSVVPGPSTGGALVQAVGFPCLMVFIGVINILYAPLCFLLRNPAVREEKMVSWPFPAVDLSALIGQGTSVPPRCHNEA